MTEQVSRRAAVAVGQHVVESGLRTVAVVGNPKPQSRTRAAAEQLTEQLTGRGAERVIDVIDLGAGLLGWGSAAVADAVGSVRGADVVLVASPTFKGTYSGVLKLFLDQFSAGSLTEVTAVPVMLGASLGHALAPEVSLKPVLVELGALCPVQGLYLLETDVDLDGARDWLVTARRRLPRPRKPAADCAAR